MILLATVATIIASQALISGAFSLTSQAIGLGLFPRIQVRHTHHAHAGQIYVPFINWVLFAGCIALVAASVPVRRWPLRTGWRSRASC
jgi:KUP system potassium uptake protein